MSAAQQFPVDLPGRLIGQENALGWTGIVLGIATLSLALTNAVSIDSWSADLPPSAGVARIVDNADRWRAAMDGAGLGTPRATLHRAWKQLEEAGWPGQQKDQVAEG
jgi:hypothetical protein